MCQGAMIQSKVSGLNPIDFMTYSWINYLILQFTTWNVLFTTFNFFELEQPNRFVPVKLKKTIVT